MSPKNLIEIEQVVEEWMAVEEAIVGGVVAQLLPEIISRFLSEDDQLIQKLTDSLADRNSFEKYRYLQQGIRVVHELGLRPAITLYFSDPQRFHRLISQSSVQT